MTAGHPNSGRASSGGPDIPPWRRTWPALVVLGVGLVVWGIVGRHPLGPDFVWVPLGGLFLIGGWRTRRRGTIPLLRTAALGSVLLLAWAGLSHAPWAAHEAPRWLMPAGLTFGRAVALALLLAYWVALEWWGAPGPRRATRLMPFVIGALTAARVWPLIARVGIDFFFGDEGTYLGTGMGMLAGEHLYTDRFEFLWPGSVAFTAGVFGLVGPRLWAVHLVLTAMLSGCVMLLYVCVAREANRGWALIGVLLCLTAFAPQPLQWSPHWMGTASGLLAIWLLTRGRMPVRVPWAIAAGCAVGLTLLFQQHKGAAVLVCLGGAYVVLAAYAVRQHGRRVAPGYLRSLAGFGAGVLMLVGPMLAWYAVRGEFGAFRSATWTFLQEGYAPANTVEFDIFPINMALPLPVLLRELWAGGSLTIAYIAPFGLLLGAGLVVWRACVSLPRWRWWLTLAGCVGVFAATLLRYQYLRLVYVAPVTCVLLAGGLGRLGGLGVFRGRAEKVVGAVVLALVVPMAVYGWRAQFHDMDRRAKFAMPDSALGPVAFISYAHRHMPDTMDTLRFVSRLPPEEAVFAVPAGAGYYLLTGRHNPTRFFYLMPGYNRPEQFAEVIAALDDVPIRYVIWDRFHNEKWVRSVYPTLPPDIVAHNPFLDHVRAQYRPVLTLDTVTVYERVTP